MTGGHASSPRELAPPGDDLLSAVAHELRTPLAAIAGFGELLRTRDDERIRVQAPARILEAVERLSPAVDEILTAFAVDSGCLELHLAPVDLGPAVAAAAERFASVEVEEGEWPYVLADEEWLAKLLEILVSSALKSVRDGGRVRVSADPRGNLAVVSVAFDGQVPGGHGSLGLYAARRLVELHCGSSWLAADSGGGSALCFTLPLAAGPPVPGLRRILIVDDDESVRSLLRLTLPADGYDIVEAADGQEAFAALDRALDLVLLDWRMPDRSGAEVLLELKASRPELAVIVLTGAHDERTRRFAASLGADAFLTKPFSPIELLEAVERLLPEAAGESAQ